MFRLYKRDFPLAVEDLTHALQVAKDRRPINSAAVANAAFFLGQALYEQGKYVLAVDAYRTASEARPDDPTVLNNLGISLSRAGLYADAEPIYRKEIEILRKRPESDPLELEMANNNLAALFLYREDYATAEPILRQVVSISQALWKDDPRLAINLNNLAALLLVEGKCSAARPLLEQAIRIQRAATQSSTNGSLGGFLSPKGVSILQSAEPLARSVSIQGGSIGPSTPGLNTTIVNFSALLICEGDNGTARDVLRETLATQEARLGPNHPDLANTLNMIAEAEHRQGDNASAETDLRRALNIQTVALSPNHPVVAITEMNLADLLASIGRTEEARSSYVDAERILIKAFGIDSAPAVRVRAKITAPKL
jgi:tetratricopeptide (TPR) repeat protein